MPDNVRQTRNQAILFTPPTSHCWWWKKRYQLLMPVTVQFIPTSLTVPVLSLTPLVKPVQEQIFKQWTTRATVLGSFLPPLLIPIFHVGKWNQWNAEVSFISLFSQMLECRLHGFQSTWMFWDWLSQSVSEASLLNTIQYRYLLRSASSA